ncbi:HAMP domain-containing sensor histidine kinase [Psychrobacillus sp. BL-248-WT-3]|uniref:HAMP domain-containing sensor histidine kinase n=1 Tax=Psychrobacillus sp. BL-248-WT-3 TaxID=2725306 RepID=UPI00146C7E11|nr:HAMP domain-containing sensor histidine kinase [Psychrobacillus sp. BL-248-WT-3]NME06888.1 HAMP domain-containing histidine kinase [Psychrobacillus sp. BL-248-WT-3]
MNRISTKLTAYFFIVVLIMETFLIFYLHQNIIHTRIEEEFSLLLKNGSNHREVLEEYYSETTMKHIVLMEKGGDREVVITDNKGRVISSSFKNNASLTEFLPLIKNLDLRRDEVLISDWEESPYIISAHPYKGSNNQSGYVVMFQSTSSIEQLVDKLNMHFGIAGGTSVFLLFIVYTALSRLLTRPLIRMKEATEKLSKGDFEVSLPYIGKDELGDLSGSIQKLADDLERMKTERNEFLASVAHELRTPLTYLIGYSNVAMRKEISIEEREQYLAIIAEESERMKVLVRNLLDLAKMDENTFTVTKDYFWAQTFFENIIKLVGPSFEMKNIKLSFVCRDNFQIHADSLRLEQIVLNLLDNALKYSKENTQVTLKVHKKEKKTIISVIDFGRGIPSDKIEFIFEKLYRVEKSRSRISGGSGIGLAVVKELVEAHGGSIEVQSVLGKGSTFTITI